MANTLHIHNQENDSRIVGTREALESLQKAINQLISSNLTEKEVFIHVVHKNGERYKLALQMKSNLKDDDLPWTGWDGENV